MSKWEMVKLGDVFKITSGGTPLKAKNEYYENGTIPWVKTGDLKQKYVTTGYDMITELGLNNSSAKLFPKDTVLIAMYGATIGACSILGVEASTNQACAAFLPNEKISSSYLYYFLLSQKENLVKMGVGGAQPNISATILKSIEISLPPLDIQKHIADTLDKTQEIIDDHKKQLEELDNLIKATFYDMFGDPVINEKGWQIKFCKDITTKIGSGSTPKGGNESYKNFGISLIRSLNVHNGYFKYDDLAYIDEEQAEKLKNVIVEKNDVLLNITGASVARSCIVPEKIIPARVNQHVSIVRPDSNYLNYVFLNCLFTDDSYQQRLWKLATGNGATREAITKQQIEALEVIVPPLHLQTKFAEIVTNSEQQKTIVKQSIAESQNLFNSLMSKYFD